jgi:hypothetical protein
MLCYKSSVCQDRLGTDIGEPLFFETKRETVFSQVWFFTSDNGAPLGAKHAPFEPTLYSKSSFYQDRLGINMETEKEAEKKGVFRRE